MSITVPRTTRTTAATRKSKKVTDAKAGFSMHSGWGLLRTDPTDPHGPHGPHGPHEPDGLTDGSFVVGSGPEVFWVVSGVRRYVPDGATFLALAPAGWQSLVHVSQEALNSAPLGPQLPSREDGKVYRAAAAPEVYVIQSLMKHHIPDGETLEAHFGGWNAVVLIEQGDCDAIPLGSPIPSVTVPPSDGTVDGYLLSLPEVLVDPVRESHSPAAPETYERADGVTYDVTMENAYFSRLVDSPFTLSPAKDVLYPGSLLQAVSLKSGRLAPVAGGLRRTGGTITVTTDINSGGKPPQTASATVPEVTFESVTDARHELVYNLNPQGGAAVADYLATDCSSASHAMVKFGISVTSGDDSAAMSGSLTTDATMHAAMIKMTQVFYSVAFTPPNGPGTIFADTVALDDVRQVCPPDNPPCYISQVDYGRTILVTIAGSHSVTDMTGAVSAAMKSAAVSGKVDVSAEAKQVLDSSTITVVLRGGLDTLALKTITDPVNNLPTYVTEGGTFTADNPGEPIRYTVRHAGKRSTVMINLAAAYQEAVAIQSQPVSRTFQVWDGPGGGPVPTDITVGNQDRLSIRASGTNWSGVILTGPYGPDGWTTWGSLVGKADRFPLRDHSPFGLCGTWNSAQVGNGHPWFWIGSGFDGPPPGMVQGQSTGVLYLGTNDDEPHNGDPKRQFTVRVDVNRGTISAAGRSGNGPPQPV